MSERTGYSKRKRQREREEKEVALLRSVPSELSSNGGRNVCLGILLLVSQCFIWFEK